MTQGELPIFPTKRTKPSTSPSQNFPKRRGVRARLKGTKKWEKKKAAFTHSLGRVGGLSARHKKKKKKKKKKENGFSL